MLDIACSPRPCLAIAALLCCVPGLLGCAERWTAGEGRQAPWRSEKAAQSITWKATGPLQVAWQRILGGEGLDEYKTVCRTDDGNIVAAGYTDTRGMNAARYRDAIATKWTQQGACVWNMTFGAPGKADGATSVLPLEKGRTFLVSKAYRYGMQYAKLRVAKLSASGMIEKEEVLSIVDRNDTGNSHCCPNGSGAYLLVRQDYQIKHDREPLKTSVFISALDNNWDVIWSKDLRRWPKALASHTWRYVFVYGLQRVANDRYVVVGEAQGGSPPDHADGAYVGFALAFDGRGNEVWSHTYSIGQRTALTSIEPLDDENILLLGNTAERNQGNSDIILLKVNPQGRRFWKKRYKTDTEDEPWVLLRGDKGKLFVIGITTSPAGGAANILVVLLSAKQEVEARLTLGGKGIDYARAACAAENDSVILCGTVEVDGKFSQAFVAKIEAGP